jgi:rhamnogalacturonyl hydrolase YesR
VRESVRQCELYCEVLATEGGCWRHIANLDDGEEEGEEEGRKKDDGLWSTGNAWAAAGMCRVLATLRKSRLDGETKKEQESLVRMIKSIFDGAIALDTHPSGLLRNRLDDESWFGEAAGSSLLAATVFRMAVLEPGVFESASGGTYVSWACRKMEVVKGCVSDETGIVGPVVNPTRDQQRSPLEGVSPEAQAFVALLVAAWKDWRGWGGGISECRK